MKTFEVWAEGYHDMEGRCPATLLGTFVAKDFRDAVQQCYDKSRSKSYYNLSNLTMYGCRLFDNEADARKTYG